MCKNKEKKILRYKIIEKHTFNQSRSSPEVLLSAVVLRSSHIRVAIDIWIHRWILALGVDERSHLYQWTVFRAGSACGRRGHGGYRAPGILPNRPANPSPRLSHCSPGPAATTGRRRGAWFDYLVVKEHGQYNDVLKRRGRGVRISDKM